MELLGRELLQAKATLMFFDSVFHVGMLQVPDHDRRSRLDVVVRDQGMILPIELPAFPLRQLAFDHIAIRAVPPRRLVPP